MFCDTIKLEEETNDAVFRKEMLTLKHFSRRILCLILGILLIVPLLPLEVGAVEDSGVPSEEVTERVYEEILTGNITNEEDVLRVALAQYASQPQSAIATYDARSMNAAVEEEENITPLISQVLEKTTDENGVTTLLVADTGLLVTDADGDAVYTDKLYNSSTGSLSQYSITATHTIYYYYRYGANGLYFTDEQVKAYKMTTRLTYGSTYNATLLEHYYYTTGSGVRVGSYTSPVGATLYTTYPSNATTVTWMDAWTHPYPGFSSQAKVYYGTKILEITIDVHALYEGPEYDGYW